MRRVFGAMLLVFIFACLPFASEAQSIFGTIRGTVTDDKGAVISSAKVRITSQSDNTTREVETDGGGNYEAPNLKAGCYNVVVQKDGFKSFTQNDYSLDARQVVRVDAVLQVGAIGETVTVEGGAAVINTETQTISSSFDAQKVLSLPANTFGGTFIREQHHSRQSHRAGREESSRSLSAAQFQRDGGKFSHQAAIVDRIESVRCSHRS